eukprot:TRINITY_DN20076_c0_g1_i1.p9 TRINITY_DN20076_c0_g1~~TRINITY_DN20076_c0_g1_i1.p9  ORF type:complete len:112 (+),score=17.46 TRINITY_DN20076_c0_g1_i1:135-470(+)
MNPSENGTVGMSLDLTKARDLGWSTRQLETDEESGAIVMVDLKLPNGDCKPLKIRSGYQVAYVKALLSEEFGYVMKGVSLWLNGKQMLDPMSLADYPDIKQGEVTQVTVKC